MFLIEFAVVLIALLIGARIGGVFLGMAGAVGLSVLVFVFRLKPASPPVEVMLIIFAVVTAASTLQASGGMDYLVPIAESILRKQPNHISILAPFVAYLFTFVSGTGNVAYSILPVISEVAYESGVRPERPMSISVIASQQAITASPISAAMAAMVAFDRTGTTRIGRFVFNHSYMEPGLITTIVSVATALLIAKIVL